MTVKKHGVHFDITGRDSGVGMALSAIEKNFVGVNKAAKSVKQTLQSGLVAGGAAFLTREMVRAAIEAEQAQIRVQAVLKATGHQAGVTKNDIDDLADSLAASTQFDDEAFRTAAASFLKFGNIQGDVFKEGLKLSADLASFMGTDVPEAAQMIGKSLQSPTEGLMAMEKQFGKLTEAQKRNIEELAQQGKTIEAQNAVLDIWRAKVGGTAELMNTGLTKATTGVKKSWDEMLESFGRTGPIGDIVMKSLAGAKSLLEDIAALANGPDPLKKWNERLAELNEQIPELEQHLAAVRKRLPTLEGTTFAADEARLKRLKAEQAQLAAGIRVMSTAGAAGNEDARDRRLRTFTPGALGGDTDKDAEKRKRDAAKAAEKREKEDFEARLAMARAYDDHQINSAETARKAIEASNKAWIESIDIAEDAAEAVVYTYDQWGHAIQLTREDFEDLEAQQKKNAEMAQELGFTFSSAFEDAIVNGEKLSVVLKGIEKDIARIIIRKNITEPIAKGIGGFDFSGVFGGGGGEPDLSGLAGGLDIPMYAKGTDFVPEDQLALVHRGEQIIPAGQSAGGVTFNNTYNVASGATEAQLRAMVAASERRTIAAVQELSKR